MEVVHHGGKLGDEGLLGDSVGLLGGRGGLLVGRGGSDVRAGVIFAKTVIIEDPVVLGAVGAVRPTDVAWTGG